MKLSPFLTRRPKTYKPEPGDPQAHRVYQMERELIGQNVYTICPIEHLEAVAAHACKKFKVPVPELRLVQLSVRHFGESYRDRIELNTDFHGQNLNVLLHELAHWITDRKFDNDTDHGPGFTRYHMRLLEMYKLLPKNAYRDLARRYGVKIWPEQL
jgi:hypothetical protein